MSLDLVEIRSKIYVVRGIRVMLDRDLATLYEVTTKVLNQAVKRNSSRFPVDFMFRLTQEEVDHLRSQFVTTPISVKSRSLPYVFTEYGTLMIASILNSLCAIDVNQRIIRAFVELRQQISVGVDYELLRERIKRIESDYFVDSRLISDKFLKLGSDVHRLSQLLDEFQDNHIVIKRPEEDIFGG